MPSQHINPEDLSRSRGYSQVVKVGHTVYIAGQISVPTVPASRRDES